MLEAELQNAVIELAELLGWRVVHFRPAQNRRGHWETPMAGHLAAGFPDLILCRERVLYRELKSARGLLSVAQQDWFHALKVAGADVDVWRPADWLDGTIERVLREDGGS